MATIFNANTTEGLVITPDTSGEMVFQSNGTQVLKVTGATGSFDLPVGTTAERPTSPTTGTLRYNTTESEIETYDGSAWTSVGASTWTTTGSDIYYTTGNVGIGTSGPAYKLDVSCPTLGTTVGNQTDMLRIRQSTNSNDQLLVWSYRHSSTTNWTSVSTRIQKKVDNTLQAYMEFNPAGNLTGIAWGTGYDANQGTAKEQMRLRSDGLLQFNSGYGSVATAYGCRAWVNFNGKGTVAIRQSGNVSSITDRGTGRYRINFSTAMPDNGYCTVASATKWDANDDANVDLAIGTSSLLQTSSYAYLSVGAGTNTSTQDPDIACVAIIR